MIWTHSSRCFDLERLTIVTIFSVTFNDLTKRMSGMEINRRSIFYKFQKKKKFCFHKNSFHEHSLVYFRLDNVAAERIHYCDLFQVLK